MRFIHGLLLGIACISEASVIPINQRSEDNLAPLFKATSSDCRPNTYIVTLCKDVDYHDHFKTIGRNLEADNSTSFKWFEYADSYYASNITSDWLYKIRSDPKVEAIDEHEPWELIRQLVPSEHQNSTIQQRDSQPWFPSEWPKAPWHLQALSAGQKLDNIQDSGPATQIKYNNTVGGGQGVNIYIIDSGVDIDHRLFQGRARNFHKCYVDTDGECFKDKVGHGTAVAGCAGARFYGTAQGANIINVKTFFSFNKRPPQTYPEDILTALKDILQEHLANVENSPPGFRGSVINMSLGQESRGGNSIRKIIQKLYVVGVPVVTSAGNARDAGVSADNTWPCKWNTICVGGMSRNYEQDWYSQTGGNVTVFAPGTDIQTLDIGGGSTLKTGTSFAAPLVAGVLATFIGWENLGHEGLDNPNLIRSRLDANLLRGILTDKDNGADLGGSENNMVTSGINYPGKPIEDPYNGVGEGIDNTYQEDYNPFEIITAGNFSPYTEPAEDPQPTPIAGPTSTEVPADVPAAATTTAAVDDNAVETIGDGSDSDDGDGDDDDDGGDGGDDAASGVPAAPTATPTPTDDRPKLITPTGDGHGCIYIGCPDDYICNSFGNCVLY